MKRGQVVATLDQAIFLSQVQQRVQLLDAETRLKRQLGQRQLLAGSEVEAADVAVELAKASLGAVGTRRRDVLGQFVIEAMALTLAGGVAGVAVGVLGAWAVNQALDWATVVSWSAVAVSFTFAAIVGMFFGFFPARRAAGLDPVEALHYA